MLLIHQALRWPRRRDRRRRPGAADRLVLWVTGIGAVALIAAALWLSGTPDGFHGTVRGFLGGQLDDPLGASATAKQRSRAEIIDTLSAFFPRWGGLVAGHDGDQRDPRPGRARRFGLARGAGARHRRAGLAALAGDAASAAALLLTLVASGDPRLSRPQSRAGAGDPLFLSSPALAVLHAGARRYAGRIFILIPPI